MRKKLLVAVLAFSATACSMTLPVAGRFKDADVIFRGEATGNVDGSGTLTVRTENGLKCSGEFQYAKSRVSGEGLFKCDDGRTGDFFFTSTGTEADGFGKLSDGEQFRFRAGSPEYTARMNAAITAWGDAAKAATVPRPLPPLILQQPAPVILKPAPVPTTTKCDKWGNSVYCTSN